MKNKELVLACLDRIIGDPELLKEFRKFYGTDFPLMKACIEADFIKQRAVTLILKLGESKLYQDRLLKASRLLSADSSNTIDKQLALIEEAADKDIDMLIDYIDGVTVWEKVEFEFTISEFLDEIA